VHVKRPRVESSAAAWRAVSGQLCTLVTRGARVLTLRGSAEALADGSLVFLVSPVLTGMDELETLGLGFADFAHHDAMGDLLLVHRTSQMSLDDAHRLAQQLEARTDQLATILELSAAGVAYFDPQGRLLYGNHSLARLLCRDEPLAAGLEFDQFDRLLCAQRPAAERRLPLLRGLAADEPDDDDAAAVVVELPHPRLRVLHIRTRRGPDGGRVVYLRDMTRESEVDRMKTEFLSTAAHELRTPMVSIFGFTELLLKRDFAPPRQRDMLQTVHRQAGVLVHLVNELLDLARIEARRGKDFQLERRRLAAVVRDTVAALLVPGDERKVALELETAEAVEVNIDVDKITLALTNVLSNAYKYSPQGGAIELAMRRHALHGTDGVRLEVRDRGIGMTPEQLARVFERFYRADPSGNIPGTGLGMCIVREIVELHGGRILVDSRCGEGTTVSLWLPCAAAAQVEGASQAAPSLAA
jgi:signal transduction histidine kinase